MPDGRPDAGPADPAWPMMSGLATSALAGAGRGATPGLEHGWEVLAGGGIVGPSDIVLAHPAIGVALLQIEPHWTADAVPRLHVLLARHRFPQRFPGHLPVIHRRLRPEHLPELPVVLREAFGWQPRIGLAPDRAWVAALQALLAGAPAPAAAPSQAAPPPQAARPTPTVRADAAQLPAPPARLDPPRMRLGAGPVVLAGGGLLLSGLLLWVMLQPEPGALAPPRQVAMPAVAAATVQSVASATVDDLAEDPPADAPLVAAPEPEVPAGLPPATVAPLAAIAEPDAPGALPAEPLPPLAAIAAPDAPGALPPELLPPEPLPPLAAVAEADAPGLLPPEPLPPLAVVAEADAPGALPPDPPPALAAIAEPDAPAALPAAPAPVAAAAPAPALAPPPPPSPSAATIALLRRGEALLAIGDISAARRFFERAAADGSGAAALALAGTFDARVLAQLGARGLPPDPAQARLWYQRALALGETAARDRLATLEAQP
jgi:hypothetical protein